jgi:hypothetical protein
VPNQHLFDLYNQHKSKILEVKSRFNDNDKMNGPFLIVPNDAYQQAALKVAFIGQETNGWSNKPIISEQMTTYSNFNLAENYKYRHGPFWSVIRKIETALTGSILSSAWLNLNRYDQDNKAPSISNQLILSELDFLLVEELKLIAPDVVIFLTGPHYDQRITSLLQGEKTPIDGFNQRKLCQIKSPALTGKIFRTYHPNYLRRASLEKDVIEAICDAVAKKSN